METRRVGRYKTTDVFLAFALLLAGGAAVVSAAEDLFPGGGLIGGPAHPRSDDGGDGGDSFTVSISIGGLAPGASTRVRQVVSNTTDEPLRYALSSSTADHDGRGLRDVVRITIKTADLSSGPAASCGAFDGATLYSGRLGATSAGFGDRRIGGHVGDRVLAAGQREALCFEIEVPLAAGNEFQGAATASVWTISIEQVAGNA